MAPSGRKRTRAKKPRSGIRTKKLLSKNPRKNITAQGSSSSTLVDQMDDQSLEFDVHSSSSSPSACSTPKAHRFRIPEILSCPPAPRKQRVVPSCSIQRRPIAFFAPPDLELFFFFALRDIPV